MGQFINGAGELALYLSIRNYIYARIEFLMEHILSKNLTLALAIVLGLLTLWIMIQGFLIATGRSQEGIKGFIFSLGKAYIIILVALGVASTSPFALRTLTDTLADGVSEVMRGDSKAGSACLTKPTESFVGCKIDQNLTMTQTIMGVMNKIDTAENPGLIATLNQAKWFAGAGSAGPGVVAGTMLIVFKIAMALFIGFGPIFILCLMFKKTAPLFQKWLYYGLATIFSGVMLGVMADISMDLVSNVGSALFLSKEAVYFVTGETVVGIADASAQQLGLGLILSTLLITVPPMAGMFFNGVMGQVAGYNYFGNWNSKNENNPAVPPSVDGGRSYQTVNNQVQRDVQQSVVNNANTVGRQLGMNHSTSQENPNQVKTSSQIFGRGAVVGVAGNFSKQEEKREEK